MNLSTFRSLSAGLVLAGLAATVMAYPKDEPETAPSPRLVGVKLADTAVDTTTDEKVMAEIEANSEIMKNLQYLCDVIGPRMTGSGNLERANKWTAERMKEYGLTNVQLEPWEIPVAWERVSASMNLLEPKTGKSFTVAAGAWSPGTQGKITGPVVFMDARTKDDLAKYKGKLKNAVIIPSAPRTIAPVTDMSYIGKPRDPETGKLLPSKEAPKKETPKKEEPKKDDPKDSEPQQPRPSFAEMRALQAALGEFLRTEGAAVILRDSGKPHGLLNMTGSWPREDRAPNQALASLFITHEHYQMLYRLATMKDAPTPMVEVEITNKFIPGPITVYNTVGEIVGSEKPDEFVVVGAHLDSWDLGSGATDNGTGSCIILEVARTLSKMAKQGIRPKRSIRFVLFTGEEQGLHGSKQYVRKHKDEMDKTSMCIVHDTGTGFVYGIGLQGREAVRKVLEPELVSLKTLKGWEGLNLNSSGGTDHLSFEAVGVPGFACAQDTDEYRLTHHTQTDTFDHVKEPNVVQGAKVIAVTALRVANLPEMLPRDKPARGGRRGGN